MRWWQCDGGNRGGGIGMMVMGGGNGVMVLGWWRWDMAIAPFVCLRDLGVNMNWDGGIGLD